MPPEYLLGARNNQKCDIWSLGFIITELLFKRQLWPGLNIAQTMRKIISLCNTTNVLEKIARENNCLDLYETLDPAINRLLQKCLTITSVDRPSPEQILNNELFAIDIDSYAYTAHPLPASLLLRCPLKQIYYWWQLAGGDVQAELRQEGLIRSEAPILYLPK